MIEVIESTLPEECPYPTHGCGTCICFQDEEYNPSNGSQSCLIIEHDGTSVPEDTSITIAGHTFIANTALEPTSPSYITTSNIIQSLLTNMNNHAGFQDYDITVAGNTLTIKTSENDANSSFQSTFLCTSETGLSIAENGLVIGQSNSTGGDYYTHLDIYDNSTGEKICSNPIENIMSIIGGVAKVCYDIASIVKALPNFCVTPPNHNDPEIFTDENQTKRLSFKIWGTYKAEGQLCGVVQTPIEEVGNPESPVDGYDFISMVESPTDGNKVSEYCNNEKLMTDMYYGQKICKDSCFYIRWYSKPPTIGIDTYLVVTEVIYADGTTEVITNQSTNNSSANMTHVANMGLILQQFNHSKDWEKVQVQVFVGGLFGQLNQIDEVLCFEIDNSKQGACCNCHQDFLFKSPAGNNDYILASCEKIVNIETTFSRQCTVQNCGEYIGGLKNKLTSSSQPKTVYIYSDDYEYISKFICSNEKYLKKEYEDGTYEWIRILPFETSYEVYRKNKSGKVAFTYIESEIKTSY